MHNSKVSDGCTVADWLTFGPKEYRGQYVFGPCINGALCGHCCVVGKGRRIEVIKMWVRDAEMRDDDVSAVVE